MKKIIGLYLRTLFGLTPKGTSVNSIDVIRYLKATGYEPEPRKVKDARLRNISTCKSHSAKTADAVAS